MTSRCCKPVGVLNVAIDCSLVGDVASPTSSGEKAARSSTGRLNAALKFAWSLETAAVTQRTVGDVPGLRHVELRERLDRAPVLERRVATVRVEAAGRRSHERERGGEVECCRLETGGRIRSEWQRCRRRGECPGADAIHRQAVEPGPVDHLGVIATRQRHRRVLLLGEDERLPDRQRSVQALRQERVQLLGVGNARRLAEPEGALCDVADRTPRGVDLIPVRGKIAREEQVGHRRARVAADRDHQSAGRGPRGRKVARGEQVRLGSRGVLIGRQSAMVVVVRVDRVDHRRVRGREHRREKIALRPDVVDQHLRVRDVRLQPVGDRARAVRQEVVAGDESGRRVDRPVPVHVLLELAHDVVVGLDEAADGHFGDVRALAGVARVAVGVVARQVAECVGAQVLRVLDAVERGRVVALVRVERVVEHETGGQDGPVAHDHDVLVGRRDRVEVPADRPDDVVVLARRAGVGHPGAESPGHIL